MEKSKGSYRSQPRTKILQFCTNQITHFVVCSGLDEFIPNCPMKGPEQTAAQTTTLKGGFPNLCRKPKIVLCGSFIALDRVPSTLFPGCGSTMADLV